MPTVTASTIAQLTIPLSRILDFLYGITSYYSGPMLHYHVSDCIIGEQLQFVFQYDSDLLTPQQSDSLIKETIALLLTGK